MTRPAPALRSAAAVGLFWALAAWPHAAVAQRPADRAAVEALRFAPLSFTPPVPSEREIEGVTVFFLTDRTLPLVNVYARFAGGFSLFGRELYAATTALPSLLRFGGTLELHPDSVDERIDRHALELTFGSAGGSTSATLNALTANLEAGLRLWKDMLLRPRFDSVHVEVWRGQELESALRRPDDPGRLAFSEFNRLMFGDHPIGWEMAPDDLEPEDLSPEKLRAAHRRILCRDNLSLGASGNLEWEEIEPHLRAFLSGWPPCAEALPEAPTADVLDRPGVHLIPRELEQTTIVMAHRSSLRQEDSRDYFASRIANSILGSAGFSSRIVNRVRTELGLSYSAGSFWTTPDDDDGIVGALARTRGESTIAATRAILEVMEEMRAAPPAQDEVEAAVEAAGNGFSFNFQGAMQIVSRRVLHEARGLPRNWPERYVAGVQRVSPDDVHAVLRRHLDPDRMVILILGDPARFDLPAETLGDVTVRRFDEIPDPVPPTGAPGAAGPAASRTSSFP